MVRSRKVDNSSLSLMQICDQKKSTVWSYTCVTNIKSDFRACNYGKIPVIKKRMLRFSQSVKVHTNLVLYPRSNGNNYGPEVAN